MSNENLRPCNTMTPEEHRELSQRGQCPQFCGDSNRPHFKCEKSRDSPILGCPLSSESSRVPMFNRRKIALVGTAPNFGVSADLR